VTASSCSVTALPGLPLVRPGGDLCQAVLEALAASDMALAGGDVVELTQKIVTKAEGRQVVLSDVTPSPQRSNWQRVRARMRG
jgi:coenzyme F420-0:L-glutamate ligase / coenzyme F420-1:gamma-L-glutamate ligase